MEQTDKTNELKFYRFCITRAPWLLKLARLVQIIFLIFTPVYGCRHSVRLIEREGKRSLPLDVFEPKKSDGILPTFLYFHGGGFGFSETPHHKKLAAVYAKRARCRVVCPDYTLLHIAPYPAQRTDADDACEWVIKNYGDMPFAVGGDSAGGALAAYCIADCSLPPRLLMLLYPVCDSKQDTVSMKTYSDTPVWNSKNNRCMWEAYLANGDMPEASPMRMKLPGKLPDVYIETAQFDCLHDEGINFADRLAKHGANVELIETQGTVHGYDIARYSRLVRECVSKRTIALIRAFSDTSSDRNKQ